MLEWLICAAGVVAQATADAGGTPPDMERADFLEFLADWDEAEAVALDVEGVTGHGEEKGIDTKPSTSSSSSEEVHR